MDAVVLTCFDIIMLHDPHELLDSITETVAASKLDSVRGHDVSLLCSRLLRKQFYDV